MARSAGKCEGRKSHAELNQTLPSVTEEEIDASQRRQENWRWKATNFTYFTHGSTCRRTLPLRRGSVRRVVSES
jgi:hypothetical protein